MTKEEFNRYYKELEKKVEKIVNKYDCNAAIHFIIGYLSADMKNVFTGTQIYELFTISAKIGRKRPGERKLRRVRCLKNNFTVLL